MTTLLFGYFDLNFGDDWLIHEFINQYHKDNVILVVSDENLYLPFKHDIRFRKVSDLGKIKAFLQSDEICIVGGSMFQDSKHWFSHYLKLYIYLLIARILGKKNYVIGCNLNAIKNKKLNMLLKLLYKQVDHFRVRDSNSVKILNKDYNINEALISVKPDLADKSKLSLTVT
ncbi:TPA: polysaccharide pyruvyl transferase family protein, partial [Escherichia coli]|nr:polysaccharide pyruvyl transferase family protein [Escherichia coli]